MREWCIQQKKKRKLACTLEADESTRLRIGESLPSHHEDHISGNGHNSLQHYNLVRKFIPLPQAMKILAAKAAVDKEWEKLEKITAWNLTKVQSRKQVIDEARTSGAKVHFPSLMDICHLKNAELEAKHQKYKGRVVFRGEAGHAKKCVERYFELANKTTQQLYKVSTPCIDDHHFKEEEMKSVGELSHVCSQLVLKCLYLERIGRLDILWSVNKFARSITKWTKACDKRLNRLISYIHQICEYKQYCHVGNTAKQCRIGMFQDSDFAGDLEDSKSTSGGTLCVFGSHTFVPRSCCARNKLLFLTVQQNLKSSLWTLD